MSFAIHAQDWEDLGEDFYKKVTLTHFKPSSLSVIKINISALKQLFSDPKDQVEIQKNPEQFILSRYGSFYLPAEHDLYRSHDFSKSLHKGLRDSNQFRIAAGGDFVHFNNDVLDKTTTTALATKYDSYSLITDPSSTNYLFRGDGRAGIVNTVFDQSSQTYYDISLKGIGPVIDNLEQVSEVRDGLLLLEDAEKSFDIGVEMIEKGFFSEIPLAVIKIPIYLGYVGITDDDRDNPNPVILTKPKTELAIEVRALDNLRLGTLLYHLIYPANLQQSYDNRVMNVRKILRFMLKRNLVEYSKLNISTNSLSPKELKDFFALISKNFSKNLVLGTKHSLRGDSTHASNIGLNGMMIDNADNYLGSTKTSFVHAKDSIKSYFYFLLEILNLRDLDAAEIIKLNWYMGSALRNFNEMKGNVLLPELEALGVDGKKKLRSEIIAMFEKHLCTHSLK